MFKLSLNLFLTILISILNTCLCCKRSKRHVDDASLRMNNLNIQLILNDKLVKEEQTDSATLSTDRMFTVASTKKLDHSFCDEINNFFCYNNGTCFTKLFGFNETHSEKIYYCVCQDVTNKL